MTSRKTIDTLILGAGLAGLSAAYHLSGNVLVAEAASAPGGTAGTLSRNGFHLDRGIHVLYCRDPWTLPWIAQGLGVSLKRSERRSSVWLRRRFVPFPVQLHLRALPLVTRLRLGGSAIRAWLGNRETTGPTSMAEWSRSHFGAALTGEFFRPYNEKLWRVSMEELSTDWMETYVPRPSARAVLAGMFSNRTRPYGASSTFWYPTAGGIAQVAQAIARHIPALELGWRLVTLDLASHIAVFQNGAKVSFSRLVSTIPLTDLVHCIRPVSPELQAAAGALKATPVLLAHVLVPRVRVCPDWHWVYVPDSAIPFYRITLPHTVSSSTCPEGWSALTLEISGEEASLQLEQVCKRCLVEMGLLLPSEMDAETLWSRLDCGYVIFDGSRAAARQVLLAALVRHGVFCLGRYGCWEYSNMESALLQGRDLARQSGP